MARRAAGKSNKSDAIRNYKKSHNGAGPTEIAAALNQEGMKVTPAFVSTVLSNDRRRSGKGRRGGARRGRPAAGGAFQSLVEAKKLAQRLGGIDKARAALDALEKILA